MIVFNGAYSIHQPQVSSDTVTVYQSNTKYESKRKSKLSTKSDRLIAIITISSRHYSISNTKGEFTQEIETKLLTKIFSNCAQKMS